MPDNDNVVDITNRTPEAHEFAETTRALDALENAIIAVQGENWTRERIVALVNTLEGYGFTISRLI